MIAIIVLSVLLASVGFSDAETFRRAFERGLGAKQGSYLYQSRDSNGESRGNSNRSTSSAPIRTSGCTMMQL